MENEVLNSDEIQGNFYVEELEERLEMTTANPPSGLIPNDICWAVVISI